MFQACVLNLSGYWVKFFPLAEFAYKNNHHSSILEAFHKRRCLSPVGLFDFFEVRTCGTNLLRVSMDRVRLIQEKLTTDELW